MDLLSETLLKAPYNFWMESRIRVFFSGCVIAVIFLGFLETLFFYIWKVLPAIKKTPLLFIMKKNP